MCIFTPSKVTVIMIPTRIGQTVGEYMFASFMRSGNQIHALLFNPFSRLQISENTQAELIPTTQEAGVIFQNLYSVHAFISTKRFENQVPKFIKPNNITPVIFKIESYRDHYRPFIVKSSIKFHLFAFFPRSRTYMQSVNRSEISTTIIIKREQIV